MHERGIDYEGREVEPAQTKSVHHFPITEDMRKDILANGLPLYNEGGIIKKAQGGTVLPTLEQMKMELMKKAKPDFNDLRSIGVTRIVDLKGKDPERLYAKSNAKAGMVQDRCLLYVFRCAVYFAETPKPQPKKLLWWNWKD